MHGTGAALGDSAAVFGAGKTYIFPDRPKQRGVTFDIDVDGFPLMLRRVMVALLVGCAATYGEPLELECAKCSETNSNQQSACGIIPAQARQSWVNRVSRSFTDGLSPYRTANDGQFGELLFPPNATVTKKANQAS